MHNFLADFLRDVYKAGKAAFCRKTSSHGEERLLRFISPVTLDLTDGGASFFAGYPSLFRDFSYIRGDISAHEQPQTGLANHLFVVFLRNKQKEAHGTAATRMRPY